MTKESFYGFAKSGIKHEDLTKKIVEFEKAKKLAEKELLTAESQVTRNNLRKVIDAYDCIIAELSCQLQALKSEMSEYGLN